MNKRFTIIISAVISAILLAALTSCGGKASYHDIVADGTSDYNIVISVNPTDEEKAAAIKMRNIIEKSTGVRLTVTEDWDGPTEHEFLIGLTGREESSAAYRDLPGNSYGYKLSGEKLIFFGSGEGMLIRAAEDFLAETLGYDPDNDTVDNKKSLAVKDKLNVMKTADKITSIADAEFKKTDSGYTVVSGEWHLDFKNTDNGCTVAICKSSDPDDPVFFSDTPAVLRVLLSSVTGEDKDYTKGYDKIILEDGAVTALSSVTTDNGSTVNFTDVYYVSEAGTFEMKRQVNVTASGKGDKGFETLYSFTSAEGGGNAEEYDYFIPSVLYKDTSNMAPNSVMGILTETSRNYVKETRTGTPLAMIREKKTGNTLTLQHIDVNISNRDNLYQKSISTNDGVRYGSVGYTFEEKASVGYCYPCYEGPYNYEFDTAEDRHSVIKRFHPLNTGFTHGYSIAMIPDSSDSYQKALITSYRNAYTLAAPRVDMSTDADLIYDLQMDVFKGMYEEYTGSHNTFSAGTPFLTDVRGTEKNVKYGFFVNGFTGAQSDVGYEMFREGVLTGDSELTEKGKKILDFWASPMILDKSYKLPVTWWSPENGGAAGTNNGHPPMLRYFVDGADGMLKAWKFAEEHGLEYESWKNAALYVADFLVKNQNNDGSYYRTYEFNGLVMTNNWNPNFFGESKLNTPIAVRFLADVYAKTGDVKYKRAAVNAAAYSYDALYSGLGKYVGGTPDNPNTTDKEAAIYAMYAFDDAYSLTGEEKYYEAYLHALYSAMSWTLTYDFAVQYPVTPDVEEINEFRDGKTSGFSFIAIGHSGIDVYGACLYYDFFMQYLRTGDTMYLDWAGLLQNNSRRATDKDGKLGYLFPGFTSEACIASDFVFYASEKGIYVPWISVAYNDPVISMRETFGDSDVYKLTEKYSLDELRKML